MTLPAAPSGIHATALVDPRAQLDSSVTVGPYTVIGPHVRIGAGTTIGAHCVLEGHTSIGRDNRIFQFATVGEDTPDLKYHGEPTTLVIGDNNVIREFVTISSSTRYSDSPEEDAKATRIGSNCLFMSTCHVGHDCVLGNHVIMANGSPLAGHVTVHDRAFIGGLTGIHQFCVIGTMAFIGGMARINKDVTALLNDEAVIKQIEQRAAIPAPGSPIEFAAFIKKEIDTWGEVVKATGTKPGT